MSAVNDENDEMGARSGFRRFRLELRRHFPFHAQKVIGQIHTESPHRIKNLTKPHINLVGIAEVPFHLIKKKSEFSFNFIAVHKLGPLRLDPNSRIGRAPRQEHSASQRTGAPGPEARRLADVPAIGYDRQAERSHRDLTGRGDPRRQQPKRSTRQTACWKGNMTNRTINLYSDTQTKPTPAMRQAMVEAEVGDEQRGEDPTVNALCARVAALLGKEDAVFLPSGTMCNEISILLHCRPGDEIICDATSHLIVAEGGAPAAIAGVMMNPLSGERGIFGAAQAAAAIQPKSRYVPRSRLLAVEQTSNGGGGTVWPLEAITAVAAVAKEAGLALHMDGARLMNAVVASGVSALDYSRPFDTVWIDLSKGLGCPIGGVLAASGTLIEEAWVWKQRMGGAMRQAGIIAAAGLYALDNHVDDLAKDHANAARFARSIADVPGIGLDPTGIETNLIYFDVTHASLDAAAVVERLKERGVLMGATGERSVRAVTHRDVTEEDVEIAAQILSQVMSEAS